MNRTLTVFCPLGLSNRLRVLLSGLALAEASERQFKMLWPITAACAAPFADLFANFWPVETVSAEAVADLPYVSGWFGHLPDLRVATDPDLIIGHPGWLIRPDQFPEQSVLSIRCQSLLDELQPVSSLQQAVTVFQHRHFHPNMIGVHLRRGDLLRERPDAASNTTQAQAAVDHFLDEYPDAGIFLCTDDGAIDPKTGRVVRGEGVQQTFRQRYGARVIWTTPRSLDRGTSAAIQDALVDLWLLRATACFVGTAASSFSEMVIFGRDRPYALVAGSTPGYRRLECLGRISGLHAALIAFGKHQTGHALPFPTLLRYYLGTPFRRLRRLLRSVASRWTNTPHR
ncbi:MAG: hypothetical protein KA765_09570 [Thermoflexales bacterium]|nr:hypothetical protein [Thermoflexales bacterium]